LDILIPKAMLSNDAGKKSGCNSETFGDY